MRRRRLKPNSIRIARKRAHFEADGGGGAQRGSLSVQQGKSNYPPNGPTGPAQHQNGQVEREKEDDIPFLLLF